MVFHWSFCNRKSSQVSRTVLSILANLSNAVVWMVSTLPLISKSSCPFINPSVSVPRAPVIIGINIAFMFHSFFNSQPRSRYFTFFSLSLNSTPWSAGTQFARSLFCCWLSYSLVVWPRLGNPFLSQNSIAVSLSHFPGELLGCAYTIYWYIQI